MFLAEGLSDKWWLPVVLAAMALPVNVVGGFTIGFVGSTVGGDIGAATDLLWSIVVATLLVSSVGVYFDRQFVSSVSDWTPSRLYYLTFLGYFGMFLAVLYVWRRHQVLGAPWTVDRGGGR